MSDTFNGLATALDSPFENGIAVTPNDAGDLANVSRALWVGTAGHIAAVTRSGASLTFKNVSGLLPGRFSRVLATGTTAADIVAVW